MGRHCGKNVHKDRYKKEQKSRIKTQKNLENFLQSEI
jgi:hypothetical protein